MNVSAVSYVVMAVMDYAFLCAVLERHPRLGGILLKPLFASAIMGAAAWGSYGLLERVLPRLVAVEIGLHRFDVRIHFRGVDRDAQVARHLLQTIVGDTGQHGRRIRSHIFAVLGNRDEIGGAELLDIFVLSGIQIEVNREAGLLGHFVGQQTGRIVAGHLDHAGTVRCRAVILVHQACANRLETTLVVGAHRHHHHDKGIFASRSHADLGTGAQQNRTDVHRCAQPVWRNKLDVRLYGTHHRLLEHLDRHRRHAAAVGGVLETLCIHVHAEDAHLAVLAAIRLESLKDLLAIVQALGGDGKGDEGAGLLLALVPLAILVVIFHMTVHRTIGEREF